MEEDGEMGSEEGEVYYFFIILVCLNVVKRFLNTPRRASFSCSSAFVLNFSLGIGGLQLYGKKIV